MPQVVRSTCEDLDRFAAVFPVWAALGSSVATLAFVAFAVALAGFESIAQPLATTASASVVVAFAARAAQRAGLGGAEMTNVLMRASKLRTIVLIGSLLVAAGALANWLTWKLAWAVSTSAREAIAANSDKGSVLQLVAILLLAPVAEEILFRYGIQRRLAATFRPVVAIFFTSVLFSCLHGPWIPEIIASFFLSVITGAWAAAARPVGGAVLLHIGWNASAALLLPSAVPTLGSVVTE